MSVLQMHGSANAQVHSDERLVGSPRPEKEERLAIADPEQLASWARRFQVSEETLAWVVAQVGDGASAVGRFFKDLGQAYTGDS